MIPFLGSSRTININEWWLPLRWANEAQKGFLEWGTYSNLDWHIGFTSLTCEKSSNCILKICEMYIDFNKSFIIKKVFLKKRLKAHFKRNCTHPLLWPALLVDCLPHVSWVPGGTTLWGSQWFVVGCWSHDYPVELCGGLQFHRTGGEPSWSLAFGWSWGSHKKW